MDMPSIHVCNKLTVENQHLTRQVRKLRRKNSGLDRELTQLKDQVRVQTLLRDYVTTKNAESQTESQWQSKREQRPLASGSRTAGKQAKGDEDKVNKLLSMHNTLLRRYEKEVKTNAEHVEAIANLNGFFEEIEDLKYALQQSAKLNQEYETTMRQMCTRFGVPFPFPDPRAPSATRQRRSRSRSNIR
uniref:Uncharacterized protein n=1 Tax=Branchiostoma floridae TaxID=7739 RepID=C3Z106_BRAFL|eukprot:XP_002597693.1 hypothetical protein BRAFLDRAFT_77403 [Branchiostoma floridae]